ncbi:MAG: hypothetical protein HFH26_09305 [Clostridiaceae bacterium]|nr:hypothetical protein [Clostridiaceae bacterium]
MYPDTLKPIDTFEKSYEIHFGFIDNRGIARPSCLFDLAQDAATLHAYQLGLSRESIGALWVLSRMKTELSRPLLPYERLTVQTWCSGIKGAAWLRSFRFLVGEEMVGVAISSWAVLDQKTHRILRPSAIEQAKQYLALTPGLAVIPGRLACGTLCEHHVHPVCYSDLDVNNHVNNVKIVDILSDGLDLNLSDRFVSALQVNYTAESRFGDRLRVLTGEENGINYVFGEAGGQNRFEGAAILSPLP